MGLRSFYHRLRGRKELYQIYADVTHSTPERCLKHHGKIVPREEEAPSVPECDFEVLSFPVGELSNFREKRRGMEEKADRELRRRELFDRGKEKLENGDHEEAISLLEKSAKIDVFIPEIEDLGREFSDRLPSDLSEELRELFILGYKEKFGQKRYERLPEKMREDRKDAGVQKIQEIFSG